MKYIYIYMKISLSLRISECEREREREREEEEPLLFFQATLLGPSAVLAAAGCKFKGF